MSGGVVFAAWPLALGLLVGALPARAQSAFSTFGASFDLLKPGTAAENAKIFGLSFAATPPGSWVATALPVPPSGTPYFDHLSANVLATTAGGFLEVSFAAPVTRLQIDFGVFGDQAPDEALTLEGFDGQGSVGSSTTAAFPAFISATGSTVSREGSAVLDPGRSFTRARFSFSAPGASADLLLDNLRAFVLGSGCGSLPAPALSSFAPQVRAGMRAGFSLSFAQLVSLPSRGFLAAEISRDASFARIEDNGLATFLKAGPDVTVPLLVDVPQSGGPYTLFVRAHAERIGCVAGPSSPVLSLSVKGNPASFVPTSRAPFLDTYVGTPSPPAASVSIKNVGGEPGHLVLSATGGFFTVVPSSLDLAPGQQGIVVVVVSSQALRAPGRSSGLLVGTAGASSVFVPVSLTVTSERVPPSSRAGTTVTSSQGRVTFVAPPGQVPAPQTISVRLGGATPNGPVFVRPVLGPSWLVISGPFDQPVPSSGSFDVTLSVDRSRRNLADLLPTRKAYVEFQPLGGDQAGIAILEVLDVEPPAVKTAAGGDRAAGTDPAFVLPTVVKAAGQFGSSFLSDGWLRNGIGADIGLDLYFTPDGADGTRDPGVRKASLVLPASSTLRLSDLLSSLFQTNGTGQAEIQSAAARFLSVHTTVEAVTNGDPASRYGGQIPVVARGTGAGAGQELVIPGIHDDDTSRTNLVLAETTGSSATATVTFYDTGGAALGATTVTVPPFGKIQLTRPLATVAPGKTLSSGSAGVAVTSGPGKLVALATVIDNRSNSFSVVPGRVPRGAAPSAAVDPAADTAPALVIPVAARLMGAQGTSYVSSLSLANGTAAPATLTLTYLYTDVDAGNAARTATAQVTIPPRGALPKDMGGDVLAKLFGVTNGSYGWMKIEGDSARVVASAGISTAVDPSDPSKGLKTAAVAGVLGDSPDLMAANDSERLFSGADKSDAKRTNLVLEEVSGSDVTVAVRLVDGSGNELAAATYTVAANQYLQITDVFGSLGLGDGPYENVQVMARVLDGGGRALAIASVIDNVSKNPEIFVLSQAGPSGGSIGF